MNFILPSIIVVEDVILYFERKEMILENEKIRQQCVKSNYRHNGDTQCYVYRSESIIYKSQTTRSRWTRRRRLERTPTQWRYYKEGILYRGLREFFKQNIPLAV